MQIFRPGADTIAKLLLASLGVLPVLAIGLIYQLAGTFRIGQVDSGRLSGRCHRWRDDHRAGDFQCGEFRPR